VFFVGKRAVLEAAYRNNQVKTWRERGDIRREEKWGVNLICLEIEV